MKNDEIIASTTIKSDNNPFSTNKNTSVSNLGLYIRKQNGPIVVPARLLKIQSHPLVSVIEGLGSFSGIRSSCLPWISLEINATNFQYGYFGFCMKIPRPPTSFGKFQYRICHLHTRIIFHLHILV